MNCYLDEPEELRAHLIELDIYQTDERQFGTLQRKENPPAAPA